MRIGLVGRGDARGLGVVCAEFARHMAPTKVLGIEFPRSPHPNDWTRYQGTDLRITQYVPRGEKLADPDALDWLLTDVDIVYTVETPYQFELFDMARARGVKTVLHVMPEFFRYTRSPDLPRPDAIWTPTTWYFDTLRESAPDLRLVLIPVARDRLRYEHRTHATRFLHVGGQRAMLDRNGTDTLQRAAYKLRGLDITIRTQSRLNPMRGARVDRSPVHNYWDLYEGFDVLILPRRYAGLSLPMAEAMACGMPVISLDVEPQRGFLPAEALIPTSGSQTFDSFIGEMHAYHFDPQVLGAKIAEFARDDALVERCSKASDAYAERISWEHLRPLYHELFEEVVG